MPKRKFKIPHFAGKVVGLVLGYFLASYTGAALGIILGHSFDYHRKSIPNHLRNLKNKLASLPLPKAGETVYRETLFLSMGYLAKLDGRISPQSIAAAEALFKRLKLNKAQREQAIGLFNEGKLVANLDSKIELLRKRYASKKAKRLSFIEQLLNLAYAGRAATPAQLSYLEDLLPALQISKYEFEQVHQTVRQQKGYTSNEERQHTSPVVKQSELDAAYRTLGVAKYASFDEIKLSYRKLMSLNHPDKLVAQGLSARALEKSKNKTQEIQLAYALIKRNLNS